MNVLISRVSKTDPCFGDSVEHESTTEGDERIIET
jgi:hypothetical protein